MTESQYECWQIALVIALFGAQRKQVDTLMLNALSRHAAYAENVGEGRRSLSPDPCV